MGRLIYGYWDCPQCKAIGIRGDKRNCDSCGSPRDSNIVFYMKDPLKVKEYVEPEKENLQPDWLCFYCAALNSDKKTTCEGCGATRENNLVYGQKAKDKAEATIETVNVRKTLADKGKEFLIKSYKPLLGTVLTSMFIFLVSWMMSPYEKEIIIESFSWEREIVIEELITYNESDWALPYGGRLEYVNNELKGYTQEFSHYITETRQVTKERLSHYETYITGYTDLGNGMFRENTATRPVYITYVDTETYQKAVYKDVPVYALKYYYKVDRWTGVDKVKTSGYDKAPYWGDPGLDENNKKVRTGAKKEEYRIHTAENVQGYRLDKPVWDLLEPDDTYTVWVRRIDSKIVKVKIGDYAYSE